MNCDARREAKLGLTLLLALFFLSFLHFATADPVGGSITSASTEFPNNATPPSRADPRSTITTLVLNAVQPSGNWKAYVGNVTGVLTLDDSSNFTIYDWDLATITGEVYASRFDNITWSAITCASPALVQNESLFHNMTDADADDINSTFNWSIHEQFDIGQSTIAQSTCNSTVTYQNDTRQTPTVTSSFQEILVADSNNYLVYAASIDDDVQGFDNESYDFQMIVGESAVKGSPTTYYFYVELGS